MKKLTFFAVVVLVGLLVFSGYVLLNKSVIYIEIKEDISPSEILVRVDDKPLSLKNSSPLVYYGEFRSGSHTISIQANGYEKYTETFSVGFRQNRTIQAFLLDKSADITAKELVSEISGVVVSNARYFGGGSWIVFYSGGEAEGVIVVAQYDTDDGQWNIIDEGSDISTEQSSFIDAPGELKAYLKGL